MTKQPTILVCGGAGYIGSHMARMLHESGYTPLILDDFSTGHPEAVQGMEVVNASINDPKALKKIFTSHPIDGVMHFAAKSLVGESVQDPLTYFQNNVSGALNILQAMHRSGVKYFIFSSTAAVYGHPESTPLTETSSLNPINPYGLSKKHVEEVLQTLATAYGISSVSLRYFNAAGAHPDADIGEAHTPETHLIPNILRAALLGTPLTLFGDDYDTPDGTCVRDYIHVQDLCKAHLAALTYLTTHPGAHTFNLGNGHGFSVMEVVKAAEQVSGKAIPYTMAPRRAGDPAVLIASSHKAKEVLGWEPVYKDIQSILQSALAWHQAQRY